MKVLTLQLLTVILQSVFKLPQLSAAALFDTVVGWAGFCIFFSALIVNSLYPSVLLRYESASLQRDAVAGIDVGLDLIYSVVSSLLLYVAKAPAMTLPHDILFFASSFSLSGTFSP